MKMSTITHSPRGGLQHPGEQALNFRACSRAEVRSVVPYLIQLGGTNSPVFIAGGHTVTTSPLFH
jgi:hypothetical protein